MKENKSDKVMKFRIGEETNPTVLYSEDLESSPFSSVLRSSYAFIEQLAEASCSINADPSWEKHTPNNILGFLGDRGSGKTSCMRSLVEMCCNNHPDDWLILNEIDPSFFDERHSILDFFVGGLYGLLKKDIINWNTLKRDEQDKIRHVQDKFREVKSAMRYLEKDLKLEDEFEIDELRRLDEGCRLRTMLKDLVSAYLSYKDKKFLIISIDDLDLNVSCSYEMMEFIRKFLIIPQIAVIIAAKYTQLSDNICLVLTRHYKDIGHRVSNQEIAEMAERYLNKMLPLAQRFEMPDVNSYLDAVLEIEYEKDGILTKDEPSDIAQKVPSLIFAKTRYLFYNSAGIPSLVIPRNLRELRMLVSMLWKMEDFRNEADAKESNTGNQLAFKNYFFQTWMGIIDPDYRPFVRHLLEEENIAKINRLVISNLYEFFLEKIEAFPDLASELKEMAKQGRTGSYVREKELLYNILNPSNSYWNVSIGDVVVIMNTVRKSYDSSKVLSLLFLIESFYSIKLYETYNQMTDRTGDRGLDIPDEKPSSAPELKTAVRSDIPEYFRLAGGSMITLHGDSVIPMPQSGRETRETRLINGYFLFTEIRDVVNEYIRLGIDTDDFDEKKIPSGLSARLRLCEFFMLTVRERVDLRSSATNRRLVNEPLYFKPFGSTAKNIIFDVAMPFVYAVYPELAYSRFNSKIFTIADKDPHSLLNNMRSFELRGKDNLTWELMSKAAIRNMEILEDLTEWLYKKRSEIRPESRGLLGTLRSFYGLFKIVKPEGAMPRQGYWVKTYDRYTDDAPGGDGKDPFYQIYYSTYYLLDGVLAQLDETRYEDEDEKTRAKERKALFDAIMSESDIFVYREKYPKAEVQATLVPICGHSVTCLAIGNYTDEISDVELASALAHITLEHRYDFTDRLPFGLKFYYTSSLDAMYVAGCEDFSRKKDNLDDEMVACVESQTSLREEIKTLKQNITQRKKDLFKLRETVNKQTGKLPAEIRNIEIMQERLDDPSLTKADRSSLVKKIENARIAASNHEAESTETEKNIKLYEADIISSADEVKKKEEKLKKSGKTYRELSRKLSRLKDDEKRLKDNYEHRIPVAL